MDNVYKTDVLIVGSGMVGVALPLLFLVRGSRLFLLIRLSRRFNWVNEFDGRASAIAATPQKMLCQIGIWQHLKKNFMPIKDIRVADGESRLFLHYKHEDVLYEALGFMVENRHFRHACMAKIIKDKNINFIAPSKIHQISRGIGGVSAVLRDGTQIDANLVVGADGRGSQVRKIAKINCTKRSYNQTAIVLTVDHTLSHNNVAHEHFLPAGPFAILPLRGKRGAKNRSSIVWTEKSERAKVIMNLSHANFTNEFNHRFGETSRRRQRLLAPGGLIHYLINM